MVLPLPYFTGAGRRRSSNKIRPNCCGELMLNGLPASTWTSAVSREMSRSISSERRPNSARSIRMPMRSMRASTRASGSSISEYSFSRPRSATAGRSSV